MSARDELREWLDQQRNAPIDAPLSGTLALAGLVRGLLLRVEALEGLVAAPPDEPAEKSTKKAKTAD